MKKKNNIYFSYHYYHQKAFLFYFYRNEVYSYDCRSDLRCIWLVFSKKPKLTDNAIYFIIRKIDFRSCLTDASSGICDLQIRADENWERKKNGTWVETNHQIVVSFNSGISNSSDARFVQ